MSIGLLNIHGLINKTLFPDLESYLSHYDLVCLTETFIGEDDIDNILDDKKTIPGFSIIHKTRKKNTFKNSGGMCIIVKQEQRKYLSYVHTEADNSLWCRLSHRYNSLNEDIYIGCVYIAPEGSKYSSKDSFSDFETDLVKIRSLGKNVVVCGDFNSYTNNLSDFISLNINDNYNPLPDENVLTAEIALNEIGLPLIRSSQDARATNAWGKLLLDCIKTSNMVICNGRFGPVSCLFTTINSSVIDYIICSPEMLHAITHMNVCDFNPVLSDVHCPLSLKLKINIGHTIFDENNENSYIVSETRNPEPTPNNVENETKVGKWDNNQTNVFVENLNKDKIAEINESINRLQFLDDKETGINEVMNDISTLFINSGIDTFGEKTKRKKRRRKSQQPVNKPWFNITCRNKRLIFNRARKKYQITKSNVDLTNVKEIGRQYKQEILKAHRTHADNTRAQIRTLRRLRNKKAFWDYCKTRSKSDIQDDVDFDKFTNFFKDLNANSSATTDTPSQPEARELNPNDRLDSNITTSEIKAAVSNLSNNRACGRDQIQNEYIKSSSDTMLPTYVLLFNFVYSQGVVPESWNSGIIKPIYKGKGSTNNPDNFRPITILSCMSKLFTAVLNSRLSEYVHSENLIGEDQIGFRSGYSTMDGVFALHSLQALLKHRKKNFFCAFIDLKKCFPSIWRSGLWHKLGNLNLGIKMPTIIQSIYQNIKSCVMMNSRAPDGTMTCHVSDFFTCENGLREGENLSPLLFSLYVNDISSFLQEVNCEGVSLTTKIEDELVVYLKVLLLMYADDTVIFSHNKKELQKSLNIYSRYCSIWKLDINTSKTKIMCFGRRGNCRFTINDNII